MQRCSLLHGLAVYALVQGDYYGGQQLLAEVIELCGSEQPYKLVRARNWLADSYLQQGKWIQAEALLRETIQQSEAIGYHRATTFGQRRLAQIAIQHDRLPEAAALLTEAQTRSIASDDHRDQALIQRTLAQLSALQGDLVQANTYLLAAIDLFERMGMRYELAAARTRLHESRQLPRTP
jgi:tetratricopeptide (TPR) repeat protein